ncbi:MAG TPA: cytochrome c oxidase subunit 3 [Candidatus Paceibacterota bacterium]|nr:cytochrome c oxidase subunit 3 [Candidatus Paceibacterota bacterium]
MNERRSRDSVTVFGFFTYLMTDFVLFAALFAVYAVMRSGTFGGPEPWQIFDARFALAETLILLASSFTAGLALLAARRNSQLGTLAALGATFLAGGAFIALEVSEFARLAGAGAGPSRSAFLSAFFTLVGTHGLHVALGLLWLLALGIALARRGLTEGNLRKLALFSLFWHFLDIVWIFIFTIVYLLGIV